MSPFGPLLVPGGYRRLLPWRLEFISRAVSVGFVVYPVVLGQFFCELFGFSSVNALSINAPYLFVYRSGAGPLVH